MKGAARALLIRRIHPLSFNFRLSSLMPVDFRALAEQIRRLHGYLERLTPLAGAVGVSPPAGEPSGRTGWTDHAALDDQAVGC